MVRDCDLGATAAFGSIHRHFFPGQRAVHAYSVDASIRRFKNPRKVMQPSKQTGEREMTGLMDDFPLASSRPCRTRTPLAAVSSMTARRLSFQPGFGFRQIVERARKMASGAPIRAGRQRPRLAHHLSCGVTIGKGTAKKQQIAHGWNSGGDARQLL